jgi:4-hydroxybenzoate polyprenyltransferase
VSEATDRCAICREPFRIGNAVERTDGPHILLTDLEHVRKPGATVHRLRATHGEPICAQCATSVEAPVAMSADLMASRSAAPAQIVATRWTRLSDLMAIARPDHWLKNVFVLPGAFVAWTMDPAVSGERFPLQFLVGLGAVCLVASSNYVLNEILDAPFDRYHPTKWHRPLAAGRVAPATAAILWILLMVAGLSMGLVISPHFGITLGALWIMGCVYNIPPLRTKDIPYLDVLSEAVNNPIRLLAGWYMVSYAFPPASLLLSYWMVGGYFMAVKRFAEAREIGNGLQAAHYRRSFAYYTADRLLVSILFYASAAMLFFGAFIMRYKFELILSFPFVALVMAVYLRLGFKANSAAQHPEKLYREPLLMVSIVICAALMIALLAVDIPSLQAVFAPTVPPSPFGKLGFGR